MRIFLSFVSEQESLAETILLALRDRGHSVFFSKDDMPPGESYDACIRKAVLASDLMIFLISPQSVTRGRYTMTELAFARQRWPNPSGRLLPVLVAPTPLNTIPAYLKAVTILEPLGNIAAETSAQVDTLPSKSHHLAILGFGLLGIATALGSYGSVVLFPPALVRYESLPPPEFPYLQIGGAPILPGLIFGLLVAACAYRFAVRDRFLLCVVVFFTALGWIAAVNSSVAAIDYLLLLKSRSSVIQPDTARSDTSEPDASQSDTTQPSQDVAPPGRPDRSGHLSPPDRPMLVVGGIVGGFVGGLQGEQDMVSRRFVLRADLLRPKL